MRKTFLAAALVPTALAMGIDSYYEMSNFIPHVDGSYRIMIYGNDCTGRGPFLRMSVTDGQHTVIYDFRPSKTTEEVKQFARKLGYSPRFIESFVCDEN